MPRIGWRHGILHPLKERTNPPAKAREEPAYAIGSALDPLGFGVERGNNDRPR
jgi:hypothetical protein